MHEYNHTDIDGIQLRIDRRTRTDKREQTNKEKTYGRERTSEIEWTRMDNREREWNRDREHGKGREDARERESEQTDENGRVRARMEQPSESETGRTTRRQNGPTSPAMNIVVNGTAWPLGQSRR